MKKREILLSEEGSKLHLPEDLWPGILSRLPVKSLLRFRCVSKQWLSLINDPGFCRLHLKNFKKNKDETHLLVVEGKQRNFVLRCSDTFETNEEPPLDTLREGRWDIQCCTDGLVVLAGIKSDILERCKLRVWNPSIRKFHDIPPFPEIEGYANDSLREEEIGLGYDPLAKDYKYFKLLFKVGGKLPPVVAVYTVGARSWKIVPSHFLDMDWNRLMCFTTMKTVYLRGSLYFVVLTAHDMELVSIDLSSEVFSYTGFPDCGGFNQLLAGPLTLVDDDGCTLAVFEIKYGTGSVWVLDSSSTVSEPKRWTKRYSFCLELPEKPKCLYLKKNGDVLLWWAKNTGGENFGQWRFMVSSYNLETKKKETLLVKDELEGPYFYFLYVSGYIESLNLLN